jgi:hypothetical protein
MGIAIYKGRCLILLLIIFHVKQKKRELGREKMRVELYKIIKGRLVLVDYGVVSQMKSYAKQGYIVVKQN